MTIESRNPRSSVVARNGTPTWSFLTNHAQVLLCIAQDPGIRLREIGETIGITERAAHRIVSDLTAAGYVTRERHGRRNHDTIESDLPVPDPLARTRKIGELLDLLSLH
ncbi:MAG: MarR family transcriptional regulator [Actinobacteria bacterium]|nr:MAG: MarR family transcriptional regulator [Actinomycetota bacterium]